MRKSSLPRESVPFAFDRTMPPSEFDRPLTVDPAFLTEWSSKGSNEGRCQQCRTVGANHQTPSWVDFEFSFSLKLA